MYKGRFRLAASGSGEERSSEFSLTKVFGLNNIYSNIILHIQFTWFMVQDLIKS